MGGRKVYSHAVITRDITEQRRTERRLVLQYRVTQILADSRDLVGSGRSILKAACECLDWEVGGLWKVDTEPNVVRNIDICHATSKSTPEFDRLTQEVAFEKGKGLPGAHLGERQTYLDR